MSPSESIILSCNKDFISSLLFVLYHIIQIMQFFVLFLAIQNSRMPQHSCCEVRVMQLHDILLLRTSAILPEAISAGGLTPTTDTSLFLTTYRGGSHLPADIVVQKEISVFITLYSPASFLRTLLSPVSSTQSFHLTLPRHSTPSNHAKISSILTGEYPFASTPTS